MLTRLKVRVTPNARKNSVVACTEDEVRLKLQAPAIEGKANAALLAFLSEITGVPRSKIRIRLGEKARIKIVELDGASAEEIWGRIKAVIDAAR